jgi:hypothetical protein
VGICACETEICRRCIEEPHEDRFAALLLCWLWVLSKEKMCIHGQNSGGSEISNGRYKAIKKQRRVSIFIKDKIRNADPSQRPYHCGCQHTLPRHLYGAVERSPTIQFSPYPTHVVTEPLTPTALAMASPLLRARSVTSPPTVLREF